MNGQVLAIALGNSFLWSVYLLLTRHVVSGAHLDAWAYTLVQLLSAGLAMLWAGRRTPGNWRDLLGWALTRKRPARRDWPGLGLLAVGIVAFAAALASDTAWRGMLWLVLSEATAVAASWMIAYHPRNRVTDLAARSRFTGEILVAASLAFILVWSLAGVVGLMASPWAGAGDAFGRVDLWLYAALAGLLFRAPGTWLGFWTINTTGVQTYLIALTAMPFFAIALEAVAARLGWLAPPALSTGEWLAAAVILAGAVWLIAVRARTTP
ncbi:MAG: hypothetical protein HYZ40_11325 [Rhodospirillales bacterium]|nr:hypothetical protein [Rhodospirillales bacterium]